MPGRGNAAGSGFEAADSGVVGGDADGASAVAADTGGGASRRDGSRFAPARAAGSARKVPGIVRPAVEEIIGLIGHQKFGDVGVAQNYGARGAKTGDECGVSVRRVSFPKQGAAFAEKTCDIHGAFKRDRYAVQRAEVVMRGSLCELRFGSAGAGKRSIGVYVNVGIEAGIQTFDAPEMSFDEFDGRNPASANLPRQLRGRRKIGIDDGPRSRNCLRRRISERQRDSLPFGRRSAPAG